VTQESTYDFAGLRSEEARERNLLRVARVLAGASERFMGRDWRDWRDWRDGV
jgi:hypothetical protein